MLKIYFISLLSLVLSAVGLSAQIVTTSPSPLTEGSKNVVIYYHADQGNKGLMGLSASEAVYAHTGVNVRTASGNIKEWQYGPSWTENLPKNKMTYVSANLWKLEIGDIRTFYGVPDDETVIQLDFVFRNANGTREGKTAQNGDIFVPLENSVEPSKPSSLKSAPPMGVTRNDNGSVTFCIAAPGKKNVTLVGSWNDYKVDAAQTLEYIDEKVDGTECRFFTITLPEATIARNVNHLYYYMIDGVKNVGDPYARLVLDPDHDKYIGSSVYPDLPDYPSEKVSGVRVAVFNDSFNDYTWTVSDFNGPSKDNLIIYELLLRDFTGTEGKALGNGTVKGAIEKIPYLKELGINAVELLPINEFEGNNSWGYNPNFYFAIDKAYGTAQDYKNFIDLCHQNGIAVILDVVFNQASGLHPWYQMYDVGENPFFNATAPHAYSVLNDWNQGYPLVQRQWKDMLQYWLKEFKVDGFRFDLVKGLGDNESYKSPSEADTNAYNASRVARMKQLHSWVKEVKPNAYFINEDLAYAKEENEMAADGELNWANVNEAGCQFAMGYSTDSNLNRIWAVDDDRTAGSTVSYLESHDEQRLAFKIDRWGAAGVKGNKETTCRRLGSAAAQLFLVPGSHMLWMFSEMGNAENAKKLNSQGEPTSENNTDPKVVNWNLLKDPDNRGLWESYKELIGIRLGNPELFSETANFKMNCNANDWTGGRTITSSANGKEIYVCINPNIDRPLTMTVQFTKADDGAYKILSKSYESEPAYSSVNKTVTVPANCYVVIASDGVSAIKDIAGDKSALKVKAGKGTIEVNGAEAPVRIWDAAGNLIVEKRESAFNITLSPGIYIIRSGKDSTKAIVR